MYLPNGARLIHNEHQFIADLGGEMSDQRSTDRNRIIEEHLPLVRTLARRFARRGEELDDLVQIGAIGLINAVDRFEPARGVSLASYAAPCIVGEMQRHLRDRASIVRIPRRIQQERAASLRTNAPRASDGHEPVTAPGGDAAAPPADGRDPVTTLLADLADARWSEIADESEIATNRVAVSTALGRLDSHQRRLVTKRFFEDRSQDEIASELGISQVQVSRLLRRSLDRMRVELDDRVVVPAVRRA